MKSRIRRFFVLLFLLMSPSGYSAESPVRTCGESDILIDSAALSPFHRKRVTPDYYGINVHCLDGAELAGVPVRQAIGAAMP